MQNRTALNPTMISVWILLFIANAVLALPTNPIVGAVAGIAFVARIFMNFGPVRQT